MKRIVTAWMLGLTMLTTAFSHTAMAAEADEAIKTAFSDGTGSVGSLASDLAQYVSDEAVSYKSQMEEAQAEAENVRREKREAKVTEEAHAAHQKALQESKKKVEEALKNAEAKRVARRQEIVNFALQFEGNPYVYGGTSLTQGADCSGFVMAVFKEFGYELPRVASAQCTASRKKDLKDIEPGDLLFYGNGISHVALYIGNGKIIHASTSASGIKISDFDYEQPVAAGTFVS